MLALHVMIKIKPNCIAEFMPLIKNQAKNSLKNEPSCKRFDVCLRKDEPDSVFLYEVYESQEALDFHRSTEYFAKYSADTENLLEEKVVTIYDEILELN